MINNLELIKPLLTFGKEGDFYYLLILVRKKDQLTKENHQSVRTIKTYVINNLEYLNRKMDEIIKLCELFGARAYININKQNNEKMSLLMLETLAKRIREGNLDQKNLFDSCVGSLQHQEKRWVVDIDCKLPTYIIQIESYINSIQPEGNKVLSIIPTKNGYHLITNPFNSKIFKENYPDIEIQRCNPTLLIFPDSLN